MRYLTIIVIFQLCACVNIEYKEYVDPSKKAQEIVNNYHLDYKKVNCYDSTTDCYSLINELNQLLLSHPNNEVVLTLHAHILYKSGSFERALQSLDKVVQGYKPNRMALSLAVEINTITGNLSRAKKLAMIASNLYATAPDFYMQLAAIDYASGNYQGAISNLNLAKHFGTPLPLYYFNLGLIYEKKTDFIQACHYYNRTLERQPHSQPAANKLAKLTVNRNC